MQSRHRSSPIRARVRSTVARCLRAASG
ncbi:MAG: hypothetical protein ACF8CQ_22665 [Rhodopirellula sp. JB044]